MDEMNRMDGMSSLPVSGGMMTPSPTMAPASIMMSGGPMVAGGPMMMTTPMQSSGPTNGMEHAIQLDEGLLQDLGWTNFWPAIQNRMQEELAQARKVRPLLPVWMDPSLDPEAIPDYTINPKLDKDGRFDIPLRARLVSVLISSEFRVSTAQKGEVGVAMHLVSEAARRVGQAEDLVLLYGEYVEHDTYTPTPPSDWQQIPINAWKNVHIHRDNLDQQNRFLFHYDFGEQEREGRTQTLRLPFREREGNSPWFRVPPENDSILPALLNGIKKLQTDGHYGPYCAVVAPDLYQAAFRPRFSRGGAWDPDGEAPIYQIRPLLRDGGFSYSRMLMSGTGVVLSLGGGALTLAVPREAHLQFVSMDRDIILSVQERIRLLINRPDAVVPLASDYPEGRSAPTEVEREAGGQ